MQYKLLATTCSSKLICAHVLFAGTSNDASHLHHPVHPHLAQDPLTGQTILISSMSAPVHAEQICK